MKLYSAHKKGAKSTSLNRQRVKQGVPGLSSFPCGAALSEPEQAGGGRLRTHHPPGLAYPLSPPINGGLLRTRRAGPPELAPARGGAPDVGAAGAVGDNHCLVVAVAVGVRVAPVGQYARDGPAAEGAVVASQPPSIGVGDHALEPVGRGGDGALAVVRGGGLSGGGGGNGRRGRCGQRGVILLQLLLLLGLPTPPSQHLLPGVPAGGLADLVLVPALGSLDRRWWRSVCRGPGSHIVGSVSGHDEGGFLGGYGGRFLERRREVAVGDDRPPAAAVGTV
mmetsp:Transcript_62227/g.184049  ORF Transcript_62227/g.184049 Transcript_62227/m.184049 type:complete len:279 (+) Transcript_62227:307-1143(+)